MSILVPETAYRGKMVYCRFLVFIMQGVVISCHRLRKVKFFRKPGGSKIAGFWTDANEFDMDRTYLFFDQKAIEK
jgi:hypothetical protein